MWFEIFTGNARKLKILLLVLFIVVVTGCSNKKDGYRQGVKPEVSISGVNTQTVGKYEKFEVTADFKNVEFDNPYDPADVDLYAVFISPSGENIKINGFFDDYRGAGKWKIRFSPGETGEYKFRIFVKDGTGTGESKESAFTSIESEHHGWIKAFCKKSALFCP